jgi:carbon monoxide dehydrogenase subunit G
VEIEKVLVAPATPEVVWALLLDPQVMGGCVPGMQSIEVLSPTEYLAVMHVKISFISAKFRLKTRIVEQRAPEYLRTEGTGEDASVASSLKQQSEIALTPLADGGTELRMKVKVDVLGRLGSFGLSVMKTKADRLWDEFGQNLLARLAPAAPATADQPAAMQEPTAAPAVHPSTAVPASLPALPPGARVVPASNPWWSRLWAKPSDVIRVEIQRGDATVRIEWPAHAAPECAAWLNQALRELQPSS